MEQKNTVADKQTAERRKFHFDYRGFLPQFHWLF